MKFVRCIEEYLLRLLRHPDALVSDLSLLRDFSINDSDDAISPGSKPGYYIFERTFRRGPLNSRTKWKTERYETRAYPVRRMFIRKVKRHLEVDITSVYDKPFPDLCDFILKNIPDTYRKKLFGDEP